MTQSTPVPEAVIEAAYSGEPLDNRPPEAMDGRTVQYIYSYGVLLVWRPREGRNNPCTATG